MKKRKLALFALVIFIFACAVFASAKSSHAELSSKVAEKWNDLTETLDEATTWREKIPRLPESSWRTTLGSDKEKAQNKVTKLLADAREILLSADAMKLLKRADEIKKRLPELSAEIEEYKNKRIGVPQTSRIPFKTTAKRMDKKIAEAEADVTRLNDELESIRAEIANELRSWGMNLSDQQAEVLFSSVIGDDMLKNAIVFENVKGVTEQLGALMTQNKSDMTIARRYYGMYITLIDVLLYTQETFVEKIDSDWIPQVGQISDGAKASMAEAKAALKRKDFTAEQRAVFNSNIRSNELTIKAAEQYSKLLANQKSNVQKCIKNINHDREVAVNTYATVRHISDMNSVISAGMQLFDVISSMQMPEIQVFDDSGVRREFEEITRRLQAQ